MSQFVTGVVFLLGAASFTFGDAGVHWMWRDTSAVAGILVVVSLICWVSLAREVTHRHPHGRR